MPIFRVVEDLDEVKDTDLGLIARAVHLAMQSINFNPEKLSITDLYQTSPAHVANITCCANSFWTCSLVY
jgi:hypothetical protein